LAPNSSNTQTWDFHWIKNPDLKKRIVETFLSQAAARTAAEIVIVTADPKNWKRSQPELIKYIEEVKAPSPVQMYYRKLVPFTYRWGFLNSIGYFKWIMANAIGLFRPFMRGPNTRADLQEVAIKSAALASENFVLAIAAQGGATCMMEGFDECRVKKLLGLGFSTRVVMGIAIGYEAERGTWGPRFRIDLSKVVHIH
jgi:nitroreductase